MFRRPSGQSLTISKVESITPFPKLTRLLLRSGRYIRETSFFDQLARQVRG
jgi:hypothetical protein